MWPEKNTGIASRHEEKWDQEDQGSGASEFGEGFEK